MKNPEQNFIALDLELNNGPDHSTPNPKIIQIGIAIGNSKQDPRDYTVKKWYIDPEEPIYPRITELTGITDEDIKTNAVSHQTAADELASLIEKHSTFIQCITWGGMDSIELLKEFNDRNVNFKYTSTRHIDLKVIYTYLMIAMGKSVTAGLKSGLDEFKLTFEGKAHRADVDAYNTLKLFFTLVNRQVKLENILALGKEIKR